MTRKLTNQDAFDTAMLSLLNQGHSCASGQYRYRGPRGKSTIGALIPDELYVSSMEGKNVRHWLTARASEYDGLRAHLGSVTPALLDELQDLHDRIGSCMPSLYRQLAVAGAQRIAHSFKLSMRLIHRGAAYQNLRGPRLFTTASTHPLPVGTYRVTAPPPPAPAAAPMPTATAMPTAAPTPALAAVPLPTAAAMPAAAPTSNLAVAPLPTATAMPTAAPPPALAAAPMLAAAAMSTVPPTSNLAAAPTPAGTSAPAATPMPAQAPIPTAAPPPDLAVAPILAATALPTAAPTPTVDPKPSTQQDDLDLIARGIAKAIAAARARDQPGS